MNTMQLVGLAVLLLLIVAVGVGLMVNAQFFQRPDLETAVAITSGDETAYARRQAFQNPVATMVQATAYDADWNWTYDENTKQCQGSQTIVSSQTLTEAVDLANDSIVIGSTGVLEMDLPAKAEVSPAIDVTMGNTTWTIPYLTSKERDGQSLALFYGGIFAEVTGATIPNPQSAVARLTVTPISAYECYSEVEAVWGEQAILVVGQAFEQEDLKIVIADFPTPVPTHTPIPTPPPTPDVGVCNDTPSLTQSCRRLAFLQGAGEAQTEPLPLPGDFHLGDAWGLNPNHTVELPHCAAWDTAQGAAPSLPYSYWLYYVQPETEPDITGFTVLGFDQGGNLLKLADPDAPTDDYIITIGGTDYEIFGFNPATTGRISCLAGGSVATITP